MLHKGSEDVESSGPNTANQTCDWLQHCGWEVMNCPVYSPGRMGKSHINIFLSAVSFLLYFIVFCSLVFIVLYSRYFLAALCIFRMDEKCCH